MKLTRNQQPLFGTMRAPEKKCAASLGGTFFILFQGFALSTRREMYRLRGLKFAASADSKGKTVGSWDLGIANACTRVTRYCSVLIS
jgi:hypothetical protein